MPTLEFRLDMSLKHQAEVYDALAKARADSPSPPASNDPPAPQEPGA
jgi:hypothetical protein